MFTMKINAKVARKNILDRKEAIIAECVKTIEKHIDEESKKGYDDLYFDGYCEYQDEVIEVLKENGFRAYAYKNSINIYW